MSPADFKRILLKVFIGFLSLTAAIAISFVLSGEFGEFQMKVLTTTFTISAVSICSMSSAALIEIRRQQLLGMVGIGTACVAGGFVIFGLWSRITDHDYWRTTATFITLGTAFAHLFLLLLPDLARPYQWVYWAAPVLIGTLALQILAALWEVADSDFFMRFISVNAILVALLTLVVPVLMRISKTTMSETELLVLKKQQGTIYTDGSGVRYRVVRVSELPEDHISGSLTK